MPEPIQLKFKDDVFLKDRIDTGENSVVRVLLGGKALVTIRELSVFTVTEESGRAVGDLQTGKLAVGVAKSLLKPGEAVEVRTPNAIAAIRGSLLVAEVRVLDGVLQSIFTAVEATVPITVSPRTHPAVVIPLSPGQTVRVSGVGAGTTIGPVQTITPAQAREAANTAKAPKPTAQAETAPAPVTKKIVADAVAKDSQLADTLSGQKNGHDGGDAQTSSAKKNRQNENGSKTSGSRSEAASAPSGHSLSSEKGSERGSLERSVSSGSSSSDAGLSKSGSADSGLSKGIPSGFGLAGPSLSGSGASGAGLSKSGSADSGLSKGIPSGSRLAGPSLSGSGASGPGLSKSGSADSGLSKGGASGSGISGTDLSAINATKGAKGLKLK
jgi:hypothetical protein